jgi:hypothetical protein
MTRNLKQSRLFGSTFKIKLSETKKRAKKTRRTRLRMRSILK